MRNLYILALVISVACFLGCNDSGESSDFTKSPESTKRKVHWSPGQPLLTDQVVVIGNDGGFGHASGGFYDVNKPIDNARPIMPQKKPGTIKDGVYRLRFTVVEGAEKVIRSAQKEKYTKIINQKLDANAYGVIQVTDYGKRIVEWRFTDERDIEKNEYESNGLGALNPKQSHPCTLHYFTDKKDVHMSEVEGTWAIAAYCPKQAGDEYEKNGIADHHELWTFTYEPYNKSF